MIGKVTEGIKRMEFFWIRHGMTEGNREKRYIGGRTDEDLCEEGKRALLAKKAAGSYPMVDKVYVSPMKRCLETAAIIYPDIKPTIIPGFRECDFGEFENKNAKELSDEPAYQKWLLQNGSCEAPFPGGETPQQFCERSVAALNELLCSQPMPEKTAFVVHGGTIMAVFSVLDQEQKSFYEYYVDNGCGYQCSAKLTGGERSDQRLCFDHSRPI